MLDQTFNDETWFAFIACADPDDDPFAESTWRKANVSLGVSVKLDDLKRKADVASRQPAALNEFLRKHLNVWTQVTDQFFDLNRWAACRADVADEELVGHPCFGGLDLGQSEDFSAFALVWALPDGRLVVRSRFWLPQGAVERHPDRPYAAWRRAGALVVTEGDVADLDRIEDDVKELCVMHGVREVAYDRRFASQLALHLQGAGLVVGRHSAGIRVERGVAEGIRGSGGRHLVPRRRPDPDVDGGQCPGPNGPECRCRRSEGLTSRTITPGCPLAAAPCITRSCAVLCEKRSKTSSSP